jgi:hypothetical protein
VLRQDGESEEWVKFNPDNIYKVNPSKTFNWEDGGDNNNGGNTEKQSYSSCPDNKHPHLIDLGLPSGTKWACCNVEANSPEQYGGVYSWGEVKTKNDYSWSNYLYGTDYIGDDIGATKYDVAFNKWGSSWRMPTIDQLKELYSKTTCSWISSYNGVGVSGMSFTGSNGKIIFLPVLNDEAINGYYWSSTYSKEQKSEAQYLWFGTKEVKTTTSNRKDGMNVRAVQNKSGGSDSGGGDDSGGGSVESGIILNPTTLEFTNYGGTKDVSITIDGKWTATCKESWIKLSNAEGDGSGKFTVEAEIYPSEPSRTAVITISYGIGKTATYYVKQNGTTFNASIKSNKFTYEGGSTTLSVKATETISWILSRSDNWVYLGKNANYQNDYKGKGNSDVEIFVGMNTNTESRSTVIALKSDFGTKEITISQSGMEDKVEAKLSSSTIKADGGSELLSITAPSSREWKIASKDSWVHFDVENGSGIKSVKVTVDKNEGYYQRSTDITVTSAGVPSKTITITQEPQKMYMTLKTSVQAFTCDENKFTISVTTIPSYLKWTAKKTETWIHFDSKWNNSSQFSYDGTYTLNVYVDENTTFSGRQASITFTSEAGTETVNITQGGRSKPNTNTTLGKMLIYPFGTVNLDMSDATYSQIKSTLGNLYKLESNSGYFFLSQDKNQSLSSYSYRGIPFYRMYVSDNKNDVQICYTFKTGSISDPGAMYDLIVEDFKDIGIPLEVYQMSNSWVKGTYETAFAKFVAEIKYSSYPAGWDYTIEVDYKK